MVVGFLIGFWGCFGVVLRFQNFNNLLVGVGDTKSSHPKSLGPKCEEEISVRGNKQKPI
jgi:hypothetical protein